MVETKQCEVWLRSCTAVIALSLFASCAGAPSVRAAAPCTLQAKVSLTATDRINPDSDGQALPTVVRVYQLETVTRLEESDFVAVWGAAEQTLGRALLVAREVTLFPGHSDSLALSITPETRFLAAVAIFRRPTATRWRSIVPLPDAARLCAAYGKRGAPNPAVSFRFDQYRAEGRSRLLSLANEHDLPQDVAPATSERGERP